MSFTEDELQAFNAILEQRLQVHRREMERAFDQRVSEYRRDTEQRLFAMQQDMLRNVTLKLTEFQGRIENIVSEKVNAWQSRLPQTVNSNSGDTTQQLEATLDQKLARQMQSIEALLNQQTHQLAVASIDEGGSGILRNGNHQLEAIEVQTEIPWEDLDSVIGQALDARLTALNEETRRLLDLVELRIAGLLRSFREELAHSQPQPSSRQDEDARVRELLQGLDHLERVIESLQVVITANHALLSDRLYTHQQQPLERAHPTGSLSARLTAEHGSPTMHSHSQPKEQEAGDTENAAVNNE